MKHHNHYARVYSGQAYALTGAIISVEVDITNGLHSFTIVGLPNKAVEEARDRVSSALKNSGFPSPKQENKKVVVSLAPAELKKEGACYDCAIAVGYLLAHNKISTNASDKLFVGELSLDGSVQPAQEILSIIRSAKQQGITECFIPEENTPIATLIEGVTIYPVTHLTDLVHHFALYPEERRPIKPTHSNNPQTTATNTNDLEHRYELFSSIIGHKSAKRALQIAAAGSHNLLLIGAPGTGKTLLAKSLCELLPRLTYEASLEVTIIHGTIASSPTTELITNPPFRSPHHTSSAASIIGGTNGHPGELTLAHHGILFLDEFPEFDSNRGVTTTTRRGNHYCCPQQGSCYASSANPSGCSNEPMPMRTLWIGSHYLYL